jgi:hypothetical protein
MDSVSDERSWLKERLFTVVGAVLRDPEWADSMIRDVDIVEAVLGEIEAAGYRLVPRERWRACLADLCHEWGICDELDEELGRGES